MQSVSSGVSLMAIAGLLVGYGTALGQRLHQRTWRVRHCAAFAPLYRGDLHLHGDGFRHRLRYASPGRELILRSLVNVVAGIIFGLGLLISGMANPAKVQNFLDLAGSLIRASSS